MKTDSGKQRITELLRGSRILSPGDSLKRAVSLLRASDLPALPVIQSGRVIGMISEADVLKHLAANDADADIRVGQAMKPDQIYANKYMTREQVADLMSNSESAVLPVIDEYGSYHGLVTRSDVLGSMFGTLRPPSPAGMATPLGVHLTSGTVKAGPGSLGLFLTGLSLFGLIYSAWVVSIGLVILAEKISGLPIVAMLQSPPIGRMSVLDLPLYLTIGASMAFMMLFLRLSPLSGYHAAEHMVVHAIESGEPLEPEIVRQMPRVHQRCGTNLLAAAAILLMLSRWLSPTNTILVGMIVVVFGWRILGGYLQSYVTTRQPNEKQLMNGIKVGQELMERYSKAPNRVPSDRERILNMGLLQTAAGLAVGYAFDEFIRYFTGFSPFTYFIPFM